MEVKEAVAEVAPEVKTEGKKEKKPKAEKPKAEKKEEAEDKDEVGPKLFSQIDIRVSEIVECWKVAHFRLSIPPLRTSTARRSTFAERCERSPQACRSSSLSK